MIGNDIIDLKTSRQESNWQRKGWLQKIFSPEEKALIRGSGDPEQTVWMLWSMKEAAYKIYNRHTRTSFYAPKACCCTVNGSDQEGASGTVACKGFVYDTRSIFTGSYIHTVATYAGRMQGVNVSIATGGGSFVIPRHIILQKNRRGIPYLRNTVTNELSDASLSHHGDYMALAYLEAMGGSRDKNTKGCIEMQPFVSVT